MLDPAMEALEADIEQGLVAYSQGRLEQALGLFERVLVAQPGNARALAFAGAVTLRQCRDREALVYLSRAFNAEPQNSHYALMLAAALRQCRHYDQAIRVLRHGIGVEPGDYRLHVDLVAALLGMGKRSEAAQAGQRAQVLMADSGALEAHRKERHAAFDALHPEGGFTPVQVNIETSGPCTRRCHYCPVSLHPARQGRLADSQVSDLLSQLQDLDYAGLVELNYYNEPLLDERIVGFLAEARRKLPRCQLRLVTNGDLLTETLALQLLGVGVDQVRLSVHSREANDRLSLLRLSLGDAGKSKLAMIAFYDGSTPLTDRVGEIRLDPGQFSVEAYASVHGCSVAGWLMIDYRGVAHLCCNDFHAHESFGDVNRETLQDIWNRLQPIHRRIYAGDYERELCRKCAVLLD